MFIQKPSFNGFFNTRIHGVPEPVVDTENKPAEKNEYAGFTKEQVEFFGKMLNGAITGHMSRQPSLADQLKEVKWEDFLAPVVQKIVPAPTNTETEPGTKKKPETSEYEKQLLKLQEDFNKAEKARVDAENRAKSAEMARKVDSGKSKLRSALSGHVNDGALDHVINHLTVISNRLVVDDDGNAKLKVKRPEYPGMPPVEMEIPVDDAINDILSESDMKIFLPVPKGSNNGNPGPGKKVHSSQFTGEAQSDEEKAMRALIREKEIAEKYGYR